MLAKVLDSILYVVVQSSTVHKQIQMLSYTGSIGEAFKRAIQESGNQAQARKRAKIWCKLKITVHTVPRLKKRRGLQVNKLDM